MPTGVCHVGRGGFLCALVTGVPTEDLGPAGAACETAQPQGQDGCREGGARPHRERMQRPPTKCLPGTNAKGPALSAACRDMHRKGGGGGCSQAAAKQVPCFGLQGRKCVTQQVRGCCECADDVSPRKL